MPINRNIFRRTNGYASGINSWMNRDLINQRYTFTREYPSRKYYDESYKKSYDVLNKELERWNKINDIKKTNIINCFKKLGCYVKTYDGSVEEANVFTDSSENHLIGIIHLYITDGVVKPRFRIVQDYKLTTLTSFYNNKVESQRISVILGENNDKLSVALNQIKIGLKKFKELKMYMKKMEVSQDF